VLPRGLDVFDGWQAYLIEDRITGRLLWRGPDRIVREACIGSCEFDRVVQAFVAALD
jgi:hypothetical protein